MSGLHRPTPEPHILELTRRLAEDYVAIPLPEVSKVVKAAAETATGGDEWTGTPEGIPAILEVIETLAREDLDAANRRRPAISVRRRADPAPKAAARRTPRRAAESRE